MFDQAQPAAAMPLAAEAQAAGGDPPLLDKAALGQIVLVFQGGGALGAYQGGVFQALSEAGIAPDWVIGTSIGAINAAIVAGNAPDRRVDALVDFWGQVRQSGFAQLASAMPFVGPVAANAATMFSGIPGFFEPNMWAAMGSNWSLGAEAAGYYSVSPLRRTLEKLIDLDTLNDGPMRLTVGAANVATGEMRYFDSRRETLGIDHVLASGALPPAFPAVRIDGELYWDGGVLSNTPVEAVFDDNPRRSGIVFAVHIWNPQGSEPQTLMQVMSREKDIRYASRAAAHIARQKQLHKLRHVITELVAALPEDARGSPRLRELAGYGCVTRMHVVRLLAPPLYGEDHSKDIDFSAHGIRQRWSAGYRDTARVLEAAPWRRECDPLEGFILHEAAAGTMVAEG